MDKMGQVILRKITNAGFHVSAQTEIVTFITKDMNSEFLSFNNQSFVVKMSAKARVHFHTRFSSGEDRGGSSPRRSRNTSRFSAISGSSTGSTPRRDLPNSEM